MWLEGFLDHCFLSFFSPLKAGISLIEIESDESGINPKLIWQHSPVTGDSFRYLGWVFWTSRTQGKYEIKNFLISEFQRPSGWKDSKITVFSSSFSSLKACISLIEIESHESDIDPKLIWQHSAVTGDSFRYLGCVFWMSRTEEKHEMKYFLISENQRPCGWRKPRITAVHLYLPHWKQAFPCSKSSQMSLILIQNLSDNIPLLPEMVLDTLDVCFGRLERKENTK